MKKKLFFIPLGLFFMIELILRIINPLYIQYGSFPSHFYKYDSIIYYNYQPNTSFKVGNKIISINKQGYIGEDFKTDDYMYKDGHLNEKGCDKIADKLCELFIKHELIPEKYHLKNKDISTPSE